MKIVLCVYSAKLTVEVKWEASFTQRQTRGHSLELEELINPSPLININNAD